MQPEDGVSMMQLKYLAQTRLPPTSTLRKLILAEPDTLTRSAAQAKIEIYVTLLYEELNAGPS